MIYAKNLQNFQDVFHAIEAESGNRVLMKYMEGAEVREITAPELFGSIRAYAAKLTARNITEGHIGIIGRSCYEWLVSFYAVLRVGAVAVLIPESDSVEQIMEACARTDITAILYDRAMQDTMDQIKEHLELPCIPFFCQDEKQNSILPIAVNNREPDDPACIFFTSGTTAARKAVVFSNRSMIAGLCQNIIGHDFTAQLLALPFHHVGGFISALNTLYLGKTLCLAQDIKYLYRYLEAMKPDYLMAVPSIVKVVVRRLKKADDYGASLGWNLRLLLCGGAKFQPEIIKTLVSRKITVMQGYGASELCSSGFVYNMTLDRPDTIGRPSAGTEAKIVDGELVIRSEAAMLGYYNDPEATEKVLRDGWYYTGDLCRQDEDGYFYLIGRKDNLIILSNGENISPEELEIRLGALEHVAEVMVTQEKDFLSGIFVPQYTPESTEREKAAIQAEIYSEVRQFNTTVPTFKRIQFIHFQEEPLAKNALGKIIRHRTGDNET